MLWTKARHTHLSIDFQFMRRNINQTFKSNWTSWRTHQYIRRRDVTNAMNYCISIETFCSSKTVSFNYGVCKLHGNSKLKKKDNERIPPTAIYILNYWLETDRSIKRAISRLRTYAIGWDIQKKTKNKITRKLFENGIQESNTHSSR